MDGDTQVLLGIVKDDLVKLATMPVVVGLLVRVGGRLLVDDDLASVKLVNVEAVLTQVDR